MRNVALIVPRVRFDERRQETEQRFELKGPAGAKAVGQQLPSRPTTTAPVVDSISGAQAIRLQCNH
jgi:hypothetical protein